MRKFFGNMSGRVVLVGKIFLGFSFFLRTGYFDGQLFDDLAVTVFSEGSNEDSFAKKHKCVRVVMR